MDDNNWPIKSEEMQKMHVKVDRISKDKWDTDWNPHYLKFCDYFLPSVVGKQKWKKHRMCNRLSDFVTPSDETFAILLYENSVARWTDLYKQQPKQKGSRNNVSGKVKRITCLLYTSPSPRD